MHVSWKSILFFHKFYISERPRARVAERRLWKRTINIMPSKWNFLVVPGQAGLYQGSSFGGLLTLVAICMLCLLLRSELNNYLHPPATSYMKLHKSTELNSIQIKFDIDFYNLPCNSLNFSQEVARASMHSHEPEHLQKEPISMTNRNNKTVPLGCRVFGYAITDKAGGMFRFGKVVPAPPLDKTGKLIESDELTRELQSYKLSHRVNHLMFLPHNHPIANEDDVPGKDHMLNGHKVESSEGVAVHQYSLQIVETLLSTGPGGAVKANQYSVTQRDIGINQVSQGRPFIWNYCSICQIDFLIVYV